MATYTEAEARERRQADLGLDFGDLFKDIENDLYSLRVHWRIYTALFGTNSERVELLNQISGSTNYFIEKALFETAMLSLCRLTDPPSSMRGKLKNITVQRVPEFVQNPDQGASIKRIVKKAVSDAEFARGWRNKRLAHSDEDARRGVVQVAAASRASMEASIESIAEVIRWVGAELMDTTIITHPISSFAGDEVAFLETLYLGNRSRNSQREKALSAAKEGQYEEAERLLNALPEWLTHRPVDPEN